MSHWTRVLRSRMTQGRKPSGEGRGGATDGSSKQAILSARKMKSVSDRELQLLAGCLGRVGLPMTLKADLKPRGLPEVEIQMWEGGCMRSLWEGGHTARGPGDRLRGNPQQARRQRAGQKHRGQCPKGQQQAVETQGSSCQPWGRTRAHG